MTHRAVHTVYGALERNWNVPQERVYTASGSSIFRATCVTCAVKPHTYTGDTTPSMMLLITLMCWWPMCGPDGTKHRVIIITSSCVCVYVCVSVAHFVAAHFEPTDRVCVWYRLYAVSSALILCPRTLCEGCTTCEEGSCRCVVSGTRTLAQVKGGGAHDGTV